MSDTNVVLHTARLVLRPWREDDAGSLYEYARDPAVGTAAGWPPHTSVEQSRGIIREVFSARETYAVVPVPGDEAVGCVGLLFNDDMHIACGGEHDAEIGYWIGVPYWGRGFIPEAVERLIERCFVDLGIGTLWCGCYDGNRKSQRVQQKCGFRYHHTDFDKLSLLGDRRTEHFTRLTREEWLADRECRRAEAK
ncbi:MAG: GNAT family N-acetyltransferase [Alistipes sp.]|nr:GNAT family N-acetyltransferase [Alistipes sp.]